VVRERTIDDKLVGYAVHFHQNAPDREPTEEAIVEVGATLALPPPTLFLRYIRVAVLAYRAGLQSDGFRLTAGQRRDT
jgi:hypothetical protein